jgi:hypothetical protein
MTNSRGSPVVVGGTTSAEQVVQNAAPGSITLSAADRAEIEVSAPGLSTCNGQGATMKAKMKDDPEDIPMAYLWYVVLAILAIVATAVAVFILLL